MAQERITEVDGPDGTTRTHTTIIEDAPRSGGGGAGWVIAIVLIVALVAGIYFFSNMSHSEAAKNNAIAGAANDIGNAAQSVGNAAQDAAKKVGDN